MSDRAAERTGNSEAERLASLGSYGILDTAPEQGFDDIVLLASEICGTPMALVSLVATDRQWFKARIGFEPCETPLSQSVCALSLWRPGLLVIPDLALDPRTRDNTLVTDAPHIRFYAGARLETPEGLALGSLCVIDTKPRPEGLTPAQQRSLQVLSRQVMTQLELRRTTATFETRVTERARHRSRTWLVSPDLLSVINDDGTFESTNPAWERTLGWTGAELRKPFATFLHPDDIERSAAIFEDAKQGKPILRFENRYRHKREGYRWLSWVAVPEDGKIYCSARDVTIEREQAKALQLYRNIVMSDAAPICVFDTDCRLIAFNKAHNDEFFRVNGFYSQIGDIFPDLFIPEQRPVMRALMSRALQGEPFTVTQEFGRPELGTPLWEIAYTALRDETGAIVGAFHHAKDISARLHAEAELKDAQDALRQSQKMEAVGQLTGGLAHDFNNLLAVVTGSLDMLERRVAQGRVTELDRFLTAAQAASKRAAALTHRLLAFSRRQTLDPKPTGVNQLVAGMTDLIRRTVGPEITVDTAAAADLWTTLVDPHQLENALLNLCINARDAMPDSGRLNIVTANRSLDGRAARDRDIPAGEYVSLSVTDTGCGMPPEVIAKAFDPFFTTKPIGQGTGLGLSMIYGFARQSGGQVRIDSEVGRGSTVCLYLPRYDGEDVAGDEIVREAPQRADQGETVLVVDDERGVRMLVGEVLNELGYAVVEAEDGAAALKILNVKRRLDLLITDVGLPGGMNGRQVADAARVIRPGLKVLFITGYAEHAAVGNGQLDPGMAVITKPFAIDVLANRIKDLISEGP